MAEITPGTDARKHFPIFGLSNTPCHYLDTAASSQKPKEVIDRLTKYLSFEHANIHRGAYELSGKATVNYDESKMSVAAFLGTAPDSIVFTRGTTESINLVAYSLESHFRPGDTILVSILEHHSNIVPWQLLASRKKLNVVFADINEDGSLNLDDFKAKLLAHKPKLVAITHISNALGTIVPVDQVVALARESGAFVLIDGAQAVAHMKIDLAKLAPDFYAFSGHKLYGPTGIGGLYAKPEIMRVMSPFMGGGDMIESVTVNGTTFAPPPQKFEAGTPPIAEAIALKSAIDFVSSVGLDAIAKHDKELFEYALERLGKVPDIKLFGPRNKSGGQSSIISFNLGSIHPHDLSSVADSHGVQFRSGKHCAEPLLTRLGVSSTARISFGVYSIKDDVDALIESLAHARKIFG